MKAVKKTKAASVAALLLVLAVAFTLLAMPVFADDSTSGDPQGTDVTVTDDNAGGEEAGQDTAVNTEDYFTPGVKKATATSITFKWKKYPGAQKYIIYRSTKKTKGYKKIKSLAPSKTTFTDKSLKTGKTYYYGIEVKTASGTVPSAYYLSKQKVRGSYKKGSVYGPGLSKKQLNTVRDLVANFVNTCQTDKLTEEQKIYLAHDYLVATCSYQTKGWHVKSANTALGALKYKKAQCSGYSRAFKALCDGMGVECRYVHANKKALNPSHQFNLVRLKGKWYLIDVQCNDDSGFDAVMLLGKDIVNTYLGSVYRYNTKGMPKLAKTSYPARDYYFTFD